MTTNEQLSEWLSTSFTLRDAECGEYGFCASRSVVEWNHKFITIELDHKQQKMKVFTKGYPEEKSSII